MVLLDLLLFLLPYPLLYRLTLVGLRAASIAVSDPFKQTLRTTIALYTAAMLIAGLADFSTLTLLAGPMMASFSFWLGGTYSRIIGNIAQRGTCSWPPSDLSLS